MGRCVVLGSGRRVSLGQYVRAVRIAKANPEAWFPQTLCSWAGGRGQTVTAEFVEGLLDRINRHNPAYGHGRKWAPDYQRALARLRQQVGTRTRIEPDRVSGLGSRVRAALTDRVGPFETD